MAAAGYTQPVVVVVVVVVIRSAYVRAARAAAPARATRA
eukprot:SAG31_NODE_2821_length_5040_cov_14.991500_8_plen_38_part_01